MESTPTPANSIRRLGWITQVLGALALLRLIPESLVMNRTWGRDYWSVVCADLVLGLLAFTAGWAFRRRKNWSWAALCLVWGSVTGTSAAILIWLIPFMTADWVRREWMHPDNFVIDSRIVIYALTLLAAPYVLWTTVVLPEPQQPSRLARWTWMLAGAASAFAFFFGLIYQPWNRPK